MNVLQTIVFGIVSASYLVVATLGFALVSRVDKFLNIAHAEFISMGAFITWELNSNSGWPLPAAGLVAILAISLLALVVSRLVYWPIRRAGPVVLLISSVGVVYLLHGATETIVKPGAYTLNLGSQRLMSVAGLFKISGYQVLTIAIAAVSIGGLYLLLSRTRLGLRLRALASDESLAMGRSIDVKRNSAAMWLIAGGLAGLAGVLLGIQGAITTDLAFGQILLILSVSILAGLGSIYGVVVAALIIGIATQLSTLVIPAGYQETIAFAAVIITLAIRPEGLSGAGLTRREA